MVLGPNLSGELGIFYLLSVSNLCSGLGMLLAESH